jgi:pyruvate dehydrogenase E1 component
MLTGLLKDPALGARIVPIVADEARTFGMANLFKQIGIYSFSGQAYEPEDIGSMLSYREATDGQILEEGISEAGAISSWTAAATSHSVHGLAMLPFYIYYSMGRGRPALPRLPARRDRGPHDARRRGSAAPGRL